jgi:small conductance mechanosensitive channel
MGTDIGQTVSEAFSNLRLDVGSLINAALIILIGVLIARIVRKAVVTAMERTKADLSAKNIVGRLAYGGVLILAILTALAQIGINVAALLAGLGIFGFALGFALQDVSKNFISGLLLLIQKPFSVGEIVQVDQYTGRVKDIQLTWTELETLDGQVVIIPSALVFTNPIVNVSRATSRRVDLQISVAYTSDLEKVRKVALEAITKITGLKDDPPPVINFNTFGSYAIQTTLLFWIDTSQTDTMAAKDAGLSLIKAAFEQAGIEIPRTFVAPDPSLR